MQSHSLYVANKIKRHLCTYHLFVKNFFEYMYTVLFLGKFILNKLHANLVELAMQRDLSFKETLN